METPKFKFKLNLEELVENKNSHYINEHIENTEKLLNFFNSLMINISAEIKLGGTKLRTVAIEKPCYPVEAYNFFEFSKEQKDENAKRIKNVEYEKEVSLNQVYKLSSLLLFKKNNIEILEYLKKVQMIKNEIQRVAGIEIDLKKAHT